MASSQDRLYKTKAVPFLGRTTRIILQNDNGPCPLLAICNVLLLKNNLSLSPDITEVSQEKLLSLVAERLIDSTSNVNNNDTKYVQNQQQNIANAIGLLPRLATGIDVNIKFSRIDGFECTPECAIFGLLDIPLYHGWILDPRDYDIANAIGSKFYNTLMEELVALETNIESEQKKNSQENFIDFAAATTATLQVPSPCFSRGISFDHSPHAVSHHDKVSKGDMEGKAELLTVLNLSGAELPIDMRNMSLNSNESAYLTKSEPEVLEETLEGKIDNKSRQDFSSFHDCSALSYCSNEVITHEAVPEQAGSYSDSSNGRRQLIDVPDAFTSRADGSEPIYEGEDREPMYEGGVVLAEQVDKRAGDAADSSKDEISPRQGDLIRNFLRNNASQLTVYGLYSLQDGLKDGELSVFFRNNHFSTMFKRDGELYILATDEGYLSQPDLVWEKLNKVNGDTLFMTGDFEEFKVESHAKTVQQPTFTGSSSTDIERIPDDLLQEIIHRILDLRDILTTSLVCRRFGRLVAKIRRVQVSLDCFQREAIPFTADPQIWVSTVQEQTIPHQIEILGRPYVQSWMNKHSCLPPLSHYLSVLRFVSTLAKIEELYIEVPSFMSKGTVPWKWAAQLDDGGLSNVIILRAANCEDPILITVKGVLRDATLILDLLVQQAYHHKNLRLFTIVDPRKRRENIEVKPPDLDFFKKGCYKKRYIRNIQQIYTSVPHLGEFVFLRYVYDGDEATLQVTESDLEKMVACLFRMVPEAIFQGEYVLEYIRGHLLSEFVLPWTGFYIFD